MRRALLALSLTLILATLPANALVNGQAPAEDDTRFDAVAAFSRSNWLVENAADKHVHNWFGNGVLVAPDVVLIARHLLPNNGRTGLRPGDFSLRFRRHTDGTLGSREAGPESFHQVRVMRWVVSDQFDLALGVLESPVEHIKPVTLLLENKPARSTKAVLAGWGSESNWQGNAGPRRELRIGENTVSSAGTFLRVDSYRTEQRTDDKDQLKPYIIDEHAVPNMHDSGGSMFVVDEDGGIKLAGIISTYTGGTWLPAVAEAGFPLEAATRGGDALRDAAKESD